MPRKRQVLTMVSIMILSFLIGTMFNTITMAMETRGNPFNIIWEAIYDLEARVTSLEESTNSHTKTWHLVTSFTLYHVDEPISPLFFVEGETWRIKWEKQWVEGFLGFIIWDENGHLIEWVQVGLGGDYPDANGICYVPYGKGSYYIEYYYHYGPNVDFIIESYH